MEARYVGETLVEYIIMDIRFKDVNKDVPVELLRYIRNYVVEASGRKGPFNTWGFKVINGQNRSIRCMYPVRDIDWGYRLKMDRRDKKKSLEAKSNMAIALKSKMSKMSTTRERRIGISLDLKIPIVPGRISC